MKWKFLPEQQRHFKKICDRCHIGLGSTLFYFLCDPSFTYFNILWESVACVVFGHTKWHIHTLLSTSIWRLMFDLFFEGVSHFCEGSAFLTENLTHLHFFSLDVHRMFAGTSPIVIISDPDMLKEILIRNFSHFYNRQVSSFQLVRNNHKQTWTFTAIYRDGLSTRVRQDCCCTVISCANKSYSVFQFTNRHLQ